MKKNNLLLLAITLLSCFFLSCSSDKDEDTIVGRWRINYAELKEVKTNDEQANVAIKRYFEEYKTTLATVEYQFFKDGVYDVNGQKGAYVVDGDSLRLTPNLNLSSGVESITVASGFKVDKKYLVLENDMTNLCRDIIHDINGIQNPEVIEVEKVVFRMVFSRQ